MSYYHEVKTADSLIEELRARIAELEAELEAINAIVAHVGTEAWEEAEYLAREEAERSAP